MLNDSANDNLELEINEIVTELSAKEDSYVLTIVKQIRFCLKTRVEYGDEGVGKEFPKKVGKVVDTFSWVSYIG